MLQLFVTTSRFLTSQNLKKKENYLKLLTIGNAVAYSPWREILTSYLNWMPKREQIVTLPTVADLPSDNPRPILVEFISGFVSFAKRIKTPGTLAQRRNSAWICTLMKRSGRLLQENVITESWLSSPESLWLLKRSTISHAIAISAPEIIGDKKEDSEYTEYFQAELHGYDYIRTDLLQNLRSLRLSELYALSTSYIRELKHARF